MNITTADCTRVKCNESTAPCATPWFVYILRCKGDRLYTGITNDLDRRMKAHQGLTGTGNKSKASKGAAFTAAFAPKEIVCSVEVGSQSEALKIEHRIKKLDRSKKVAALKTMGKMRQATA